MYVRPELTLRSAQGFFVSLTAETYYKKGGTAMADNKKWSKRSLPWMWTSPSGTLTSLKKQN